MKKPYAIKETFQEASIARKRWFHLIVHQEGKFCVYECKEPQAPKFNMESLKKVKLHPLEKQVLNELTKNADIEKISINTTLSRIEVKRALGWLFNRSIAE